MRLTAFTDYALRTLIYVALHPDRVVTIAEVAAAYQISNNHLMKVVQHLAQTGDLITLRGQRGGLRLARPPNQISIGRVVRDAEPDMELVSCFGDNACCAIQSVCKVTEVFGEALRAFLSVLDQCSLADLLERRSELSLLLGSAKAVSAEMS
jgi:Rrf2 family transcriptional regulator, nitric oxide-sensitive transcriptional repressor